MIIGTASDIRSLGQSLAHSCNELPEKENTDWPRLLKGLEISNAKDYEITFYLETADGIKPKGNGFPGDIAITVQLFLIIIGFISFIRWLIGFVL